MPLKWHAIDRRYHRAYDYATCHRCNDQSLFVVLMWHAIGRWYHPKHIFDVTYLYHPESEMTNMSVSCRCNEPSEGVTTKFVSPDVTCYQRVLSTSILRCDAAQGGTFCFCTCKLLREKSLSKPDHFESVHYCVTGKATIVVNISVRHTCCRWQLCADCSLRTLQFLQSRWFLTSLTYQINQNVYISP